MKPVEITSPGAALRAHFNVLSHPNSKKVQLEMLDFFFAGLTDSMENALQNTLERMENILESNDSSRAFGLMVSFLTQSLNANTNNGFSPLIFCQMPFNSCMLRVSALDIKQLPGFAKLHELAKSYDVAISVSNLVDNNETASIAERTQTYPTVTLDLRKSYAEGLLEDSNNLAPHLPAIVETFDPNTTVKYERVPRMG